MSPSDRIAIVVAALLLVGAGVNRAMLPRARDAAPFHAKVRGVSTAAPVSVGTWKGEDVPVPTEAVAQLRPNVLISRRYRDEISGRYLSFLLVQCSDVRDLVPHYPPVCYPGRGLTLGKKNAWSTTIDGLELNATRYEFESNTFQHSKLTVVDNFVLLPDGRVKKDMDGVEREIGLPNRYFGAAQIQIVYDRSVPTEERAALTRMMLTAYKPLIDAMLSGAVRK